MRVWKRFASGLGVICRLGLVSGWRGVVVIKLVQKEVLEIYTLLCYSRYIDTKLCHAKQCHTIWYHSILA